MKLNKRINSKKNYSRKTIILFAVMFIGLGFAALSATLGINGLAKIGHISFDVHFDNVEVKEGSMEAESDAIINPTDDTQIDFSLILTKPGEYYEFEADIVNVGTLDGYLSSIEVNGLDEETSKYLDIDLQYADGDDIQINDFLGAGEEERIRVRVDFLYDITLEDLPTEGEEVNFTLNITYAQDNGRGIKRRYYYEFANTYAILDSVESRYVTNPSGIDFMEAPSDDNGKGLYVRAGTENDEHPILYFRGGDDFDEDGIEDSLKNHVIFGGYCWKIVRTTEKGGTKLIYDGIPNDSGECKNTGEFNEETQIGATFIGWSSFNEEWDSLADVGYMYGERYEGTSEWDDEAYVYGSDVTYSGGVYTLTKPSSSDTIANIKTKHYTCRNNETTCNTVYYVYSYKTMSEQAEKKLDYNTYAIELTGGKKIEDVINESFENKNDSAIKTYIDEWFKDNLESYESKLEDAVWCNDRSMVSGGYLKDSDLTTLDYGATYFSGADRLSDLFSPSITPGLKDKEACPNPNDRFTKYDTINGNGALTYPVGLLTADEATVAGHGIYGYGYSETSYLNSGSWYWLLSPTGAADVGYRSIVFNLSSDGYLYGVSVFHEFGVRPAVVLKNGTLPNSGDGSKEKPFIVDSIVNK